MAVSRGLEVGTQGDIGQLVQISSYRMSKFWGSSAQHDDYSEQYCIAHLAIAKVIDLNVLTTKNIII